jgi:ATP-dependent protease ClpP protease subunit
MKHLLIILSLAFGVVFAEDKIVLTDTNTIMINSGVDEVSTSAAMLKILELNSLPNKDDIYLVLSSPGGSIYAGIDFIRFAKGSRRKINTISLFSASMAFQIMQSLGDRLVVDFSTIMSHKASGEVGGSYPGQLQERLSLHLAHSEILDQMVVARTNGKQTKVSYEKLIQNEYWANADKAIADGFADKKVTVSCDESLNGTNEKSELILGIFPVTIVYSNCPLIVPPLKIIIKPNVKEDAAKKNVSLEKEVQTLYYKGR